jgi:hypothetical protein
VELGRSGVQPTMPLLGQFCIQKLGLQMKVGGQRAECRGGLAMHGELSAG